MTRPPVDPYEALSGSEKYASNGMATDPGVLCQASEQPTMFGATPCCDTANEAAVPKLNACCSRMAHIWIYPSNSGALLMVCQRAILNRYQIAGDLSRVSR